MLDTVRLYVDAAVAVAIMATLGVISGLAAAALTSDRSVVIVASVVGFMLTAAVLVVRLWRVRQKPALPLDP